MKQKIDSEKFVTAWQKSDTTAEVASALGLTTIQTSAKAANLRKNGVKLKPMSRGKKDYSSLRALAESLLPSPSASIQEPEPAPERPAKKKARK